MTGPARPSGSSSSLATDLATETVQAAARASRASGRLTQRGLVIQTAWLGDVVLTTALIRRAAERLGVPVDVVTIPASAGILQNNPHVRDVITYDKKDRDRGVRPFLDLVRKLRARRYAVAYLAQTSLRSALLAWLARIPMRIGFRDVAGTRLYTHAVMSRGEPHQLERLLKLADGAPDRREPEVFPSAGDREAVDRLLGEAGIGGGEFVAIAPGAAWATKRWPYFPELARALAGEVPLAVVGGPGDRADARAIRTALGGLPLADGTGTLTVLQSAELIRRAALLVAGDTAPAHLASAMRTPVVEIFGPTAPQYGFAARSPHTRIVEPDPLPCRPCSIHGPAICPLGHHKCMRDIPIGAVLAEVRTVLQIVRLQRKGR